MSCHFLCRVCFFVATVLFSCHVTSRHVTSRHVTSRHVVSRHVTSRHITLPCPVTVLSYHVTSCCVLSRHVQSLESPGAFSSAPSRCVVLRCLTLRHANARDMSRYVLHVNSANASSRHVSLRTNTRLSCAQLASTGTEHSFNHLRLTLTLCSSHSFPFLLLSAYRRLSVELPALLFFPASLAFCFTPNALFLFLLRRLLRLPCFTLNHNHQPASFPIRSLHGNMKKPRRLKFAESPRNEYGL